jgi:hypothetical protein
VLPRLPEQHVRVVAAGRHAFELAALDHPVPDVATLLPPQRSSPAK